MSIVTNFTVNVDDNDVVVANQLSLKRGQRTLFRHLSFVLQAGQVLQLLGDNGQGKTSLIKMLLGMFPVHGQLAVCGVPAGDRNDTICFIGHDTSIKPTLTAIENLCFASALFDGLSIERQAAEMALTAVGLAPVMHLPCQRLSAGQKRRVVLARLCVSAKDKRLWLLDEPLSALDKAGIAWVEQRIAAYTKRGGAVIITSHQPLQLASTPIHSLDLGACQ